jgi:hypothetical protein
MTPAAADTAGSRRDCADSLLEEIRRRDGGERSTQAILSRALNEKAACALPLRQTAYAPLRR